jgi:hypothetical protein
MEQSAGKVSVCVIPTKLVGDVAVSLSFKMDLEGCALCCLTGCMRCACEGGVPVGADEAAAAYALYLHVSNALCGDPVAAQKSKVGAVCCGSHNGAFVMSWKMKGVLSHVRKALGIAIKNLTPGKLFGTYANCMRAAGHRPNKEAFNEAAHQLVAGINAGVDCCVVGAIKTDAEKLKATVDVLKSKVNPGTAGTPRAANKSAVKCTHDSNVEVKVSGWAAFVLSDVVRSQMKGVVPAMCNKSVIIPMKASSWESAAAKLKSKSSDYIKLKYGKLKDSMGDVLAYLAASNAALSCADLKKLSKVKEADVISSLKAGLA